MKNISHIFSKVLPAIAVIGCSIAGSCAKIDTESSNISAALALEAWVYSHYGKDVGTVGHGTYILEDNPGSGIPLSGNDSSYLRVRYEGRKRTDSSVVSFTDSSMAIQLNSYAPSNTYVPEVIRMMKGHISQGLMDIINGGTDSKSGKVFPPMRIGGSRIAVVPGWLSSTQKYYDTEDEYKDNVTGTDNIYRIEVLERIRDIRQWQIDSIENYMDRHSIARWDTASHQGRGFYYWRDYYKEISRGVLVREDISLKKDTVIYLNYVGRLLNGKVFDTNIEKIAKDNDIFSSSTTYEPVQITCSKDSTAITMGSNKSSIINGFAYTIWNMHPYESGIGIFDSALGYGKSGNGRKIPGYSPLLFEIDIVDEQ